jgi:carboxymethylenebutenolidase
MPDTTYSADSRQLPAHLAVPAGDGPWPGLVVVHEVFGLTDDIRRQTDRLAAHGYLSLAPDLADGASGGAKVRCVMSLLRQVQAGHGPAFGQIDAARAELAARPDCTGRVGVIGFCMGGGFALVAAARYDFDAASVNYGFVPKETARALDGTCPVVASYGKKDPSLRGKAAQLERALSDLEVPHDVKEYAEAGHTFLSEYQVGPAMNLVRRITGMRHEPDAAADAWIRIFDFFDEHLKADPEGS